MKVLHISTSTLAGAGSGAFLLHRALQAKGVESSFLTLFNEAPNDDTRRAICTTTMQRIKRFGLTQLDGLPLLMYFRRKPERFSFGRFGFDVNKLDVAAADIIHLHWVNHGMIDIASLRRLNKPIVWTLRDMWAITGGCHHAFDCQRFTSDCGKCPHLGSTRQFDISYWGLKRKKRYYPGTELYPVAISKWLGDCAMKSAALRNINLRVIHNGIDMEDFRPCDRHTARAALGLPADRSIILVGATNILSAYKGFSKFLQALPELRSSKYYFVFFGKTSQSALSSLELPYTNFGEVFDVQKLRQIYAAADVFLAPSVAEAFGKTLVEAMACGTPVVCFDHGGPRDIVIHKQTGWRAVPFDPHDLALGVRWVLNASPQHDFATLCRKHAFEYFNIYGRISDQYIELYETILSQRKGREHRQQEADEIDRCAQDKDDTE